MTAALALTACNNAPKQEAQEEEATAPKALILYYSQTGTTKTIADLIQKHTEADEVAFTVKEAYPADYGEVLARCQQEKADGAMPELDSIQVDFSQYDVIYLGYPIWFETYANPVASLLETGKLNGKKIVPFCTFGSCGRIPSAQDLKKNLPDSEITEPFGIRAALIDQAPAQVENFLIKIGMLEGEYQEPAAYGQEKEVTPEETAIFTAAVGDYPMLKATAVKVAERTTATGTDYKFTVDEQTADGVKPATVYVTAAEGAAPVFTEVIR